MRGGNQAALAYLWRHHRAALVALALALLLAVLFAVRLTVFAVYWSDPSHRDQGIEGWMTPGYVARSWDVDIEVVRAALPPGPAGRDSLDRIAAARGIPLPELTARIADAIEAARAE